MSAPDGGKSTLGPHAPENSGNFLNETTGGNTLRQRCSVDLAFGLSDDPPHPHIEVAESDQPTPDL